MPLGTYTPDGNKIVHVTGVDFNNRSKFFKPVHVVQYDDKLPVLAISTYNNGEEYVLPSEATAKIRVGKPGRKFVEREALGCSEDRKIIYFEITLQMVTNWGKLYPIVTITIGDTVAGSSPILMVVDRNPIQEGDIESTNDFADLTKSVEQAKEYAEQAKQSVKGTAENAQRAEQAADRAENAVDSINDQVARAESAADRAESAVRSFDNVVEEATSSFTDTVDSATGDFNTAVQEATASFNETSESAKKEIDEKVQQGLDDFNQIKDETIGRIEEMENSVKADVASSQQNAETAKQYSGNPPRINDEGRWDIWNADTGSYQDSGIKAFLNFDVTYASEDEMNADVSNQPVNTLAIISTDVDTEENSKLYIKSSDGTWHFLSDLSGFTGVGIQSWEKTNGNGDPGTTDTYKVTWTDGRFFTYDVYNGKDGEGRGDMESSIYDPDHKNIDIFQYVDTAVEGVVTEITEETGTSLSGLLKGDGATIQIAEPSVDYVIPNDLDKKQDKLIGTKDQIVSFDDDGGVISKDFPDTGDMKKDTYDSKGKNTDIFDYVDDAVGKIKTSITEETETSFSGILKGNGSTVEQAVPNEDYVTPAELEKKQNKLTGQQGQVLGFDENGDPKAEPIPEGPEGFSPTVETQTIPTGTTVTITDKEGIHEFTITNGTQGPAGVSAGFGDISAEIDTGTGVPSVEVEPGGTDAKKTLHFSFHNLKGDPGPTGAIISDSEPNRTNVLWIDTSIGGVPKYYSGSDWVPCKSVWG